MSYFEPISIRMSDVQSKEVRWLWRGMIPRGKLTVLCGDPGLGKSFVTLDLCARASRGGPWPLEEAGGGGGESVDTVLLSAEDDPADTIRPRLEAMGADLSRVQIIDAMRGRDNLVVDFVIGDHSRDLSGMLEANPAIGLLVVDPVSAYVGGTDSYNNAQVRSMLKPLSDLAADHGVAVVLVTHMRKSEAAKALHGAMGSLAFTAAARVVLLATRDPNDADARLILTVKSNLSCDRSGYRYRIEEGRVRWTDQVRGQADEILQGRHVPTRIEERQEFAPRLREFLLAGPHGTRTPAEVQALCAQVGYSFDKLQRLSNKQAMGVASSRNKGSLGWHWHVAQKKR